MNDKIKNIIGNSLFVIILVVFVIGLISGGPTLIKSDEVGPIAANIATPPVVTSTSGATLVQVPTAPPVKEIRKPEVKHTHYSTNNLTRDPPKYQGSAYSCRVCTMRDGTPASCSNRIWWLSVYD